MSGSNVKFIMVKLGNDWDNIIGGEFKKEYYLELREFLKAEYSSRRIYPDMYDIFNALKATPYSKVKVVIIGQDPYHAPGQAHGMCFSVKPGVEAPPSLQNIFKELEGDLGCTVPADGYLMKWAEQGVLLLNAVLTVRAGQADSHKGKGWENFTDKVIEAVNEKEEPVVFMLWGRNARMKKELVTNPRHLVLETVHPSPLSASRGFFGCRHFSKANDFLVKNGIGAVDWQL